MNDNSLPASDTKEEGEASERGFRFVADYGLLTCLGEGGMGEVWAARDASSPKNRVVALKTTKQQGVEAAKILYDEARIASLIEHPNVSRVHHLGRSGDTQFLVMDYCDGGSLHDLLEASPERKLGLGVACRILANAASGLHAAHELTDEDGTPLGVVHRDVSPQNILISSQGLVTMTDFGVAKAAGQAHKATETGEMKGKLSYMAPEQVTSKDIDARADVFALGCVLYQMTLGQRPFHGDDALSTLYQLLEEELTVPSAVDPAFPTELEAVITKALEKDKEKRFQSAAEFGRALEEVMLHLGDRPTEADIATLMMDRLGDSIRERKEEIQRRNEALSNFDRAQSSKTIARPPEKRPSDANEPAEQSTTQRSAQSTAPVENQTRTRLIALIVFGAIAALGILLVKSKDSSAPPRVAPAPEADKSVPIAPAPPSTKKPEPVTLEVSTTPTEATISVDGKEVGVGSYVVEMEKSSDAHVLEVNAKGYEPVTKALVFDKSQTLTIALSPAQKAPPKPPRVAPPQASSPRPEPKPPLRKPPAKPPRKLDSDNPFASP